MTVSLIPKDCLKDTVYTATSLDAKPSPASTAAGVARVGNTYLYETDTGNMYIYDGTNWLPLRVGGAQSVTDFYAEVQKGNILNHSMVHKFGRNDAVPNGSWEFVHYLSSFTAWPLSAATTVRIKAGGNAADNSAGNGAREVTVQGIDSNGDEVTETIATNGASASAVTTTQFWRVHRAWVSAVGTYGISNYSSIVIENGAGGTDLLQIRATEGQTQFAGWTSPTGYTSYLLGVNITVDASKAADIRIFTREDITDTTAPVKAQRLKLYFDGITGSHHYKPAGPEMSFPGLTDIWAEARGSGAATQVAVNFELLVVKD